MPYPNSMLEATTTFSGFPGSTATAASAWLVGLRETLTTAGAAASAGRAVAATSPSASAAAAMIHPARDTGERPFDEQLDIVSGIDREAGRLEVRARVGRDDAVEIPAETVCASCGASLGAHSPDRSC